MLLTVSVNSSLDTAYIVPGLIVDGINRVKEKATVPGGKGNNVARVLRELGYHVVASGFAGGSRGATIHRGLEELGVVTEFVWTAEESRTCLALIDPVADALTQVLEPGAPIASGELLRLKQKLSGVMGEYAAGAVGTGVPDAPLSGPYLLLAGSLPPGVPGGFYAELIHAARSHGFNAALDASGEALRLGLKARPAVIKVNVSEAAEALGMNERRADALTLAESLQAASGCQLAVVTAGREGAAAVGRLEQAGVDPTIISCFVRPPTVSPVVSPVGSGDAFLAGMVGELSTGRDVIEALKTATACGAANALTLTAATIRKADAAHLREGVKVA
ncbi:MAG: 1-phosphofructokinase family hexose kinase [Bacillota bacterium]